MEEIDNNDKYDPEHNMQYCHKYLAHSGAITAISILYDELYFLTTSTDNIIKLWYFFKKIISIENSKLNLLIGVLDLNSV